MYRITYETTNRCNMRCKYCYLEHEQEPLTEEMALKAIDVFENSDVDHRGLKISFIGGEPLLYKKNIINITKKIRERMEKKNIPVEFVITTNATLLDNDIIDFFIKEKYSLKISIDGYREDHDSNRILINGKSSYDKIIEKLPLLQRYQNESSKSVQISMVINKETYHNVYKNIIHIIDLGFKFICPCLETYALWTKAELRLIEEQLNQVVVWMVNEAKTENYVYLKPLIMEHSKRNSQYDCLYCFPGRNSMHIKVNGDIYACYACQKEAFKLGNVATGFDNIKYLQFKEYHPDYSKKCKNCNIFKYCSAKECIAVNYERTNKMWEVPDCFCEQAHMYERLYNNFLERKKLVLEQSLY